MIYDLMSLMSLEACEEVEISMYARFTYGLDVLRLRGYVCPIRFLSHILLGMNASLLKHKH